MADKLCPCFATKISIEPTKVEYGPTNETAYCDRLKVCGLFILIFNYNAIYILFSPVQHIPPEADQVLQLPRGGDRDQALRRRGQTDDFDLGLTGKCRGWFLWIDLVGILTTFLVS